MDIDKQQFADLLVARYVYAEGVKIPTKVHFVDDINLAWHKYALREKVRLQFANMDFSGYNGLVMPFDGNTYHILVKDSHLEYPTTIIHECTHVCDFERFRVDYNDGGIDIENNQYYWAMCLYSEFHARAMAHKNFLQFAVSDDNRPLLIAEENTAILEEITKLEQTKGLKADDSIEYELMQYLGRLFANKFDIKSVEINSDIKAIYTCLKKLTNEWTAFLFHELIEKLRAVKI